MGDPSCEMASYRSGAGVISSREVANPGSTPPINQVSQSGYWLKAGPTDWRVHRGPGEIELRRAIKLGENFETVDQAICLLNCVIEGSRREARYQATVSQALYMRSAMHLKGNRFQLADRGSAFADLCSAIAIEPNYSAAWLNRAGMHFEDEHYEQALGDVDTAIKVWHAPGSSWPTAKHSVKLCALHANRGTVLEAMERGYQAYIEYTEAVRLNPSDNTGPGPVGNCYYKAGRLLVQEGHTYNEMSTEHAAQLALDMFGCAVRVNPQFYQALGAGANQHLKLGSYAQAISMYKECLKYCNDPEIKTSIELNLETARGHWKDSLSNAAIC